MKTVLIHIVLLFVTVLPAAGSVFLPQEPTGVTPKVAELLATLKPGQTTIQIDDMVFRASDLRKSGFTGTMWPNGIVYYQFDAAVTQGQRANWLEAAHMWECAADLSFVQRTDEDDYINVISGTGNFSSVGMVGGEQDLSVVSWNNLFIIAHEIAHALGQIHEQSRSDRDSFVMVHLDRVCQDCCSGNPCDGNFDLEGGSTNYGAYDFDSVMHYGQCFFSTCNSCSTDPANCRTITVLPPNATQWQNAIGQRNHLSDLDLAGMAQRYGPSQNQIPQVATSNYAAHPDQDCCLNVTVDDIDGGSSDPDGADDVESLCITAIDGNPVGCQQDVDLCGVGTYELTLTMTDSCGETDSGVATVEVTNEEPVAVCKPHSDVADEDCCIVVDLADIDDGSFDPDGAGDIDTVCITAVDGSPVGCLQTVDVCGVGEHLVTITMTDHCGATSSCDATVTVIDETPPDLSITLSRYDLWPPNHKLVEIQATAEVSDNCDDLPEVVLLDISSNEPLNGPGDGNTDEDYFGTFNTDGELDVVLRSERRGRGDGRIYTIAYQATDDSGNSTVVEVEVEVPHDQSGDAMVMQMRGVLEKGLGFGILSSEQHVGWVDGEGAKPSTPVVLDAKSIDLSRVYLGNTAGVLSPEGTKLVDLNEDGANDLVAFFSLEEFLELQDASDDSDGAVGFHFRDLNNRPLLVTDILQSVPVSVPTKEPENGSTEPDNSRAAEVTTQLRTRITALSPNPFNPSVAIHFELARSNRVQIEVVNALGARVRVLTHEVFDSGRHVVTWNGTDKGGRAVASGLYFFILRAGDEQSVRKALLMK